MKLTNDELREVADRCEKATPGPWHIIENVDTQQLFGGYMAMMQLFKAPKKSEEYAEYWLNGNDAAFVEQSRTDIPRLLDHIKALEDAYLCEVAGIQTLMDLRADQCNQRIDAYEEMAKRADERMKMLEEEKTSALDILLSAASDGLAVEETTDSELITFIAELKLKIDGAIAALKGANNQ